MFHLYCIAAYQSQLLHGRQPAKQLLTVLELLLLQLVLLVRVGRVLLGVCHGVFVHCNAPSSWHMSRARDLMR